MRLLLAERRFRLLWLGQTTSFFGDALIPVATAFAVLDLTHSASDLGIALAAQTIPFIGFVLVGGVWADRLPTNVVMLASDVIRGTVQAVAAALLLTGNLPFWGLVGLLAIYGTAQAFFQPAATAIVPNIVKDAHLQQANAVLSLSRRGTFVVGPAVAGLLVAGVGPGVAFAIDAGTFVASFLSLAFIHPHFEKPTQRPGFIGDLRSGWREFTAHAWLWVSVLWGSSHLFFHVAREKLSRVSSYDVLGSYAFTPLGYLVAGSVAAHIGIATTLWISAGWVAASTAVVLILTGIGVLRWPDAEPYRPPELASEPSSAET